MSRMTYALLLLAVAASSAYIVEEVSNQCDDKYGFCDPAAERVNSGYCGIDEQTCSNEGFCWDTNPAGDEDPYCYYPNSNTAPDGCYVPYPDDRVNCGYGPQSACEGRDCCWAPLPPGVDGPWCYNKV